MEEPLILIAFLVAAFVFSALLAYWITGRRSRPAARPEPGTTLRLRGTGGMYRAKLLACEESLWRISCPLSRNSYVPLRVDDRLTVEAPVEQGVLIFRTTVGGRDDENHELLLVAPAEVKVTDRRSEKRRPVDTPVTIEGDEARLVDLSSLGARIVTNRTCHVGERVRLELSEGLMYGWVLDFWPTRSADSYRDSVRVRFEEVLTLPATNAFSNTRRG